MANPCNEKVQQLRLRLWCFTIKKKNQYLKIPFLKLSFAPLRILQKLEASWVYNKEGSLVWMLKFHEGLVDNFQTIFMALISPKCPGSRLNSTLQSHRWGCEVTAMQCSTGTPHWAQGHVSLGRQLLTPSTCVPRFCWSLNSSGVKHQGTQLKYVSSC